MKTPDLVNLVRALIAAMDERDSAASRHDRNAELRAGTKVRHAMHKLRVEAFTPKRLK